MSHKHREESDPRVLEERRTATGTAGTRIVPDGYEGHRCPGSGPRIFYPPPHPLSTLNGTVGASDQQLISLHLLDLTRTRVQILLCSTITRSILNG